MRIRYIFHGDEKTFDSSKALIVVGRPDEERGLTVDLDLTPDFAVSRLHARIRLEDGKYWIEDSQSTRGTKVDNVEIKGRGKVLLTEASGIRIGDTALFIECPSVPDNVTISPIMQAQEPLAFVTAPFPSDASSDPASGPGALAHDMGPPLELLGSLAARKQRLLYELLFQASADASLDSLLQFTIQRLVVAVASADRGALMLKDSISGEWLLKAHYPNCEPSVSVTLAEHAVTCGGGFIWKRGTDLDISVAEIASGIYAPLTWHGDTYGLICLDNGENAQEFTNDDLELVVAAAQHAALVIANHRLREDLRRNVELVERLLTNFSPAIRRKLLGKAKHGRLRLGGEKSEVTILVSDIRGFTAKSAKMDAGDVVDMLNSYFSALVGAIFRHDGTVDKFVGDAILAVFGSPEPDDKKHIHAVSAALAMQEAVEEINVARRANRQVVCEIGIGVHCGEVLHGFIGSEERMEFTVIGDAVNRAARYCDGAGPGQVLISREMYERVFRSVTAKPTSIKTKHEGDLAAYCVEALKAPSIGTLPIWHGNPGLNR